MTNEITINIEELLKVDDDSITDYETIRQIGLLSCTKNDISKDDRQTLYRKVKREFQYCGLYPTVMKSFDILPD
jgi:2-phosphoglycerate kinase